MSFVVHMNLGSYDWGRGEEALLPRVANIADFADVVQRVRT